ncbi:DNA topoisomerase I, partial [sediment metagenome]
MIDAQLLQTRVDVAVAQAVFRATGSIVTSPGFLKVYQKGTDVAEENGENLLPSLKEGDALKCQDLTTTEHETKPPARYTEASLIKVLESEGVGRPSTYASIMSTIVDRGYVRREGTTLKPTFTAMIVVQLLKDKFPDYVDTQFTSAMEESLDEIAGGEKDYLDYLKSFYLGTGGLEKQIAQQEKQIDPEQARSITFETMPEYV